MNYILTVAGTVLLSALLSAMLPEGKMGKFVKGMSSLIVFMALVSPFLSFFEKKTFDFGTAELGGDEAYLLRCAELAAEEREEDVSRFLREEFSLAATATAECGTESGFPLKKLTLKLSFDGIIGQDGHIDMSERVKAAIESRYGCEAEIEWETD